MCSRASAALSLRASASVIARSTRRRAVSPSSAQSSAARSDASVSCSRCAIRQRGGNRTSPISGEQPTAQQREQARLADTVATDQRNACGPHEASGRGVRTSTSPPRFSVTSDSTITIRRPAATNAEQAMGRAQCDTPNGPKAGHCTTMHDRLEYRQFFASLGDDAPPGVSAELQALWWAA